MDGREEKRESAAIDELKLQSKKELPANVYEVFSKQVLK